MKNKRGRKKITDTGEKVVALTIWVKQKYIDKLGKNSIRELCAAEIHKKVSYGYPMTDKIHQKIDRVVESYVGEVGKSVFDEKKINEQLKKVTKQESKKISTQQETKTIEVPKGGLADLLKKFDTDK